jgi:hypothetical protein
MAFGDFIKEHRDRLKGFLDKLTNDSHVPIALLVFTATSAYHFYTHRDLGTNYTNSLYALYGFLGGHALVYQKWPDQNPPAAPTDPTVNVTVDNSNSNANANSNTNTATANANAAPAAPDPSKG